MDCYCFPHASWWHFHPLPCLNAPRHWRSKFNFDHIFLGIIFGGVCRQACHAICDVSQGHKPTRFLCGQLCGKDWGLRKGKRVTFLDSLNPMVTVQRWSLVFFCPSPIADGNTAGRLKTNQLGANAIDHSQYLSYAQPGGRYENSVFVLIL